MPTTFVELDVRPTLRSGGEPFQQIMQTVAALAPGQGLRLFATFKPVPLFSMLGSKGFDHEAKELDGGDWEVLFRPAQQVVSAPELRDPVVIISMYQASVPRLANVLGNLSNILNKAQAHIDARMIDVSVLMGYRLFPDMFPFSKQVQIACDKSRSVVARLAAMDVPFYKDDEENIAELKLRISNTITFIQSVSPEQIDGTEDKEIVLPVSGRETHYKGMQLLLGHSMPNVYFHVVTAYNILRHVGVAIGKRDFLGNP